MAAQSDLFVSAWGRQEGPQWGSPYLLFLGRGGIPSLRIFDRLASPAVSKYNWWVSSGWILHEPMPSLPRMLQVP